MPPQTQSGCLGFFSQLFGLGPKDDRYFGSLGELPTGGTPGENFPYGLRDEFLSAAELRFHRVLSSVVPDEALLLVKVRIADILYTKEPNRNQGARNKVQMKHVDFLIVEREWMRPLVAIELDDASHNRQDRRERDAFVNQAFLAAGLPLVHIRCAAEYDRIEVAEIITQAMG